MSLYEASVPQLTKMLENLSSWLDKASSYAKEKGFDPNVLVSARLAPDQYEFSRQVQAACDAAKFAAARLTGKEAPKHPDTEKTLDELKERTQKVIAYLQTFAKTDFEGAKERLVELPFLQGKVVTSSDYLNEMALPNFYFHTSHAYAILRHNGVALGKMDFIGGMNVRDR